LSVSASASSHGATLGTLVTNEMRVAKGKSARSKLVKARAMLEAGNYWL